MIIVFDDMCNLCNAYVRFLVRHDHRERLSFVTASSDEGRDALIACGQSPDDPATMIVIDGQVRLLRSDAVLSAVAALGGVWRGAQLGRMVPRRLRDIVYGTVASRRYRWFGRAQPCTTCGDGRSRR